MTAGEFKEKYLPLGEPLYRVAFYMLESCADAEDAVQDLFVRLWSSRDSLGTVRNPKAYCITMLRNICIDRIRAAASGRTEEMDENIAVDGSADTDVISRERMLCIMKAAGELSEGEREVLKMRVLEGMSYGEISSLTGRSGLTLRVQLSNARRKIRKAISL